MPECCPWSTSLKENKHKTKSANWWTESAQLDKDLKNHCRLWALTHAPTEAR